MLAGIGHCSVGCRADHDRIVRHHLFVDHDNGVIVNGGDNRRRIHHLYNEYQSRVIPHASHRNSDRHGRDVVLDLSVAIELIVDLCPDYLIDADLGGLCSDHDLGLQWRLCDVAGIGRLNRRGVFV
jgi:hypothetical protein